MARHPAPKPGASRVAQVDLVRLLVSALEIICVGFIKPRKATSAYHSHVRRWASVAVCEALENLSTHEEKLVSKSNRIRFTRRQVLKTLGVMSLTPWAIAAEPFPSRPIRIIVAFPAGASTDFLARVLADRLAAQLNQPVTVENKPGAGGIIATQQLAKAVPDGYTIGIVSLATVAMVPATLKEAPYDAVADFAALSALVSNDMWMVTSPRAPGTLREFVAWATRQQPSAFLATLGAGTSGHFAGFRFGRAANIKFEPVHYKNLGDLTTGLIAGDVHAFFAAPSSVASLVKAGRIRLLATNGASRAPDHPDVPTFAEVGYPDMHYLNWVGIAAPAKTPAEIVTRLSAELIKAANVPEVRKKLEEGGFQVIASTRDEFAAMIRKDVAFWRDFVKTTGFKA
jgi:tripartite-type tricarboxylate transporter receptor subunit TctC